MGGAGITAESEGQHAQAGQQWEQYPSASWDEHGVSQQASSAPHSPVWTSAEGPARQR